MRRKGNACTSSAPALVRVALDARGLQQALRNSPDGGLGGVGRYCLELIAAFLRGPEEARYLLLVDHGTVPTRLRQLIESSERASMHRIGVRTLRQLRRGRLAFAFDVVTAPLIDLQIRRLRPDVVHFLDQPAPAVRLRPRVVTFYDFYTAQRSSLVLSDRTRDALLRRALRHAAAADLVVCISEHTARLAEELLSCDPGRIRVFYPGIDTALFRPVSHDSAEARDAATPPYFLHVGVLRQRKNPAGLLRAFRELAADDPSVELVCAGPYQVSPSDLAAVRRLAKNLGLADRIRVAIDCTDEELVSLYQGAIALVLPSFDEGFGYPAVEALACGTPCVVSRAGALPEVSGALGVFVEPSDPISIATGMRRAMRDHPLRERVRAFGPKWSEQFSSDAAAASLTVLYRRLALGSDVESPSASGMVGDESR